MANQAFKLGKLPPKPDYRTLQFEQYATDQLPPPPSSVAWEDKMPPEWGMMRNDLIGDCTCASAGHMIMNWTGNALGSIKTLSDDDILTVYEAVSGYDPRSGINDNGAYLIDVLNYWRRNGIGQDKILGYVALEFKNTKQLKQSVNLFGGC